MCFIDRSECFVKNLVFIGIGNSTAPCSSRNRRLQLDPPWLSLPIFVLLLHAHPHHARALYLPPTAPRPHWLVGALKKACMGSEVRHASAFSLLPRPNITSSDHGKERALLVQHYLALPLVQQTHRHPPVGPFLGSALEAWNSSVCCWLLLLFVLVSWVL